MLNLIRNNFLKGCIVRFLTDLSTKIEKRQQQDLPEIPYDQKRGKPHLRSINFPRTIIQASTNKFLIQQDFNHACTHLKRPHTHGTKKTS
jgi:hypothetical protein